MFADFDGSLFAITRMLKYKVLSNGHMFCLCFTLKQRNKNLNNFRHSSWHNFLNIHPRTNVTCSNEMSHVKKIMLSHHWIEDVLIFTTV